MKSLIYRIPLGREISETEHDENLKELEDRIASNLPKTGTATNSSKLEGKDANYFTTYNKFKIEGYEATFYSKNNDSSITNPKEGDLALNRYSATGFVAASEYISGDISKESSWNKLIKSVEKTEIEGVFYTYIKTTFNGTKDVPAQFDEAIGGITDELDEDSNPIKMYRSFVYNSGDPKLKASWWKKETKELT